MPFLILWPLLHLQNIVLHEYYSLSGKVYVQDDFRSRNQRQSHTRSIRQTTRRSLQSRLKTPARFLRFCFFCLFFAVTVFGPVFLSDFLLVYLETGISVSSYNSKFSLLRHFRDSDFQCQKEALSGRCLYVMIFQSGLQIPARGHQPKDTSSADCTCNPGRSS